MSHLVLDLGRQGHLPLEGRRLWQALSFGERAHDLGVGVHLDELEHPHPVVVGHPGLGLDLSAVRYVRVEVGQFLFVRHASSSLWSPRMISSANLSPIWVGPSPPPGRNHAYVQLTA